MLLPTVDVNPHTTSINLDQPHDSPIISEDSSTKAVQQVAAHILTCPHADLVTFWKPPIDADAKFKNPFKTEKEKYVTFEPGKQVITIYSMYNTHAFLKLSTVLTSYLYAILFLNLKTLEVGIISGCKWN